MAEKSRLLSAVESRSLPHLLCLLKEEDYPQEELDSALHLAAFQGQEIAVRMLFAIGANKSSVNVHGEPLLLEAVHSENIEVVKELFEEGYDVNFRVGDSTETRRNVPLHMAICSAKDSTAISRLLIEKGAMLETLDVDGDSPLIAACNENNLELVELLIEKKADTNVAGYEGNTALHRVAQSGNGAMAKALIGGNASLTLKSHSGATPFMEACLHGRKSVAELCLDSVDPKNKDKNGKNSFHLAAEGGNHELVDMLIQAGVDYNAIDGYGNTPLILSAFARNTAFCDELLDKACDLDLRKQGESQRTALHWAVTSKTHQLVHRLLERDPQCVDSIDEAGDTALIIASKSNDLESVIHLCRAGADISIQGEFGRNPIHWAVQNKNMDVLKVLLEDSMAGLNVTDSYGNTPLLYAAMNATWPELLLLLDKKADINAVGDLGRSALHWVVKNGALEMVKTLIERGAQHDIRDRYGDTPLSVAVKNIQEGLVPELLRAGADPGLADREGRTPLHVAALYGLPDTVRALLGSGADPSDADKSGNTPLVFSCHKSHRDIVTILLDTGRCALNAIGKDHKSSLYLAAQNGLEEVAVRLLKEGAFPDQDECVPTPLIQAAKNGLQSLVGELLEHGADPHARDLYHRTALMWAAETGHLEVIKTLEGAGADPRAQDDSGDTALTLAAFHGREEVLRHLAPQSHLEHREREEGMTALHLAICKDFLPSVKALLEAGVDINVKDAKENTALLTAAAHTRGTGVLQALLSCGQAFDIDYRGVKGRALVHWAVGDPSSLSLVLKHKPDLNHCDRNGASPLLLAIAHNQPQSARLLVEAGCDYKQVHQDGRSAIHHAALYGDAETTKLLIEKGVSADHPTKDNRTPLLLAAIEGHIKVIRHLLSNGCDVNRVYGEAATALSVAVDYKRYDTVRMLLASGANPNLIGAKKLNPLKACVVNDDILGAFILLQAGAGKDGGSQDAIQVAAIKNHLEMLHLLVALECDINSVRQMLREGTIFYFIQDDTTLSTLKLLSSKPRNLQMLSRQAVRNSLRGPLLKQINKLPLPKKMKEFLSYRDVEVAWFQHETLASS